MPKAKTPIIRNTNSGHTVDYDKVNTHKLQSCQSLISKSNSIDINVTGVLVTSPRMRCYIVQPSFVKNL